MSVRRLIAEVDVEGLNVTEFCAQHGVRPGSSISSGNGMRPR